MKQGPKGPDVDIIRAVGEMKRRNASWGYRILNDVEQVRLAEIKKILKSGQGVTKR
jgi:hypothetical protein